jgi:1-acyl-sn-glycerol-3-phosphate acyltransferase/acyl carrier protein
MGNARMTLLARTGPGGAALNRFLAWFVRSLLWFRYRVRVTGLKKVTERGKKGILFLQNHPALIDPVIVTANLLGTFRPRPLADETQIDRFFIRWLSKRINVLPIPKPAYIGAAARDRIEAALDEIIESLQRGENVLLSPAGRLCRNRLESLRGASAADQILQAVPDVRVVLVRTRGLWGSSFSWAWGHEPKVRPILGKAVKSLLAGLLFFMPRREVTVELHEPDDLPRRAGRAELNRFIEDFYNADAPYNTYVPYTRWERGGVRQLPEPVEQHFQGDPSHVPAATRQIVTEYLQELTGVSDLRDDQLLAEDLGLDSLAVADMTVWLESEFGFPQGNVESLRTVGDVMLAACGEIISSQAGELRPIPHRWFDEIPGNPPVSIPEGEKITDLFLQQADRGAARIVAADQTRGAVSYRDVITAVYVLRPLIEALPGERVGIMLPASVGADILFLSTLFAGKTPVMVNWTAGIRNVKHSLDLVDCQHVLTAHALVSRLKTQGIDLSDLSDRLVLFTTVATDREIVNRVICKAGLSGLHNMRRVIPVDKIPLLGTGKTDYRELARRLAAESSQG